MRRHTLTVGFIAALLCSTPLFAEPAVVILGSGAQSTDPVTACGALASSPWEADRVGAGVADEAVFLDNAVSSCEAALAAAPGSIQAQTWLARAYILIGRAGDARRLLEPATIAGSGFAAYLLSTILAEGLDRSDGGDGSRALELLVQASDAGYAPATTALAERYENGDGVELNNDVARSLYESAANAGFGSASYRLGYLYVSGIGVDYDNERAMTFYQQAIEQGEPRGYYGVGQLYELGYGVEQDYARASEYYQLGADRREPMSQTALAYLYEQGLGVAQDYDRSFALLVDAAGQGWRFAQAALSIHYLFGQGTAVDAEKGYDLALTAQQNGIVYASGIVGYVFQNGLGTNRNLTTAKFYYETGANAGDQYSAGQLPVVEAELACQEAAGSPYEPLAGLVGRAFVDIVADEAIAACENAASVNPGPVGNRVWLARAYVRAERYDEALPLLEEGVAAGNALAHTVLADMLLAGWGVERDPQRALSLYQAVSADFGLAQYTLGLLYAEGVEVPQDRTEALRWLRLADSYGVDEAAAEIAALMEQADAPGVDLAGFGREGPAY